LDYKRKLIEYDLPLVEISHHSAKEKSVSHSHLSSVHRWWARRPLAASRATIFASLIDDPGSSNPELRENLNELIKNMVPWDAVKDGNDENVKKAKKLLESQFGNCHPKVLDPFAGGGSIPLECLRFDCETYCSDYNPVAVLIEKASIEWPNKFGINIKIPEEFLEGKESEVLFGKDGNGKKYNLLSIMVKRWGYKILGEVKSEIGQFYEEENFENRKIIGGITEKLTGWLPAGFLWVRTIPCQNPSCSIELPLIRQFWLSNKKNKKVAYRPLLNEKSNKVEFELLESSRLNEAIENGFDPNVGTVSKGNANCIKCGQITKAKEIRQLGRQDKMGERLVAVVFHHPNESGKRYRLAASDDFKIFRMAQEKLNDKLDDWPYFDNPLPIENIPIERKTGSSGFRILLYGMEKWKDLFNSRQQLLLITFIDRIKKSKNKIVSELNQIKGLDNNQKIELSNVIIGYLSLLLSKLPDFNSRLSRWRSQVEGVAATFGRQALPMRWDYIETNQISGAFGNFDSFVNLMAKYIESNSGISDAKVYVDQGNATELKLNSNSLDAVITDPPYYDNVAYADLSEFFYVWLKRILSDEFPGLFSTPLVPKSKEAILEPKRHDGRSNAKIFFEQMLQNSFEEINRVLKPGGVAVVVYAHKTTDGWESMLTALINAGLVVTSSWPIHTERKERLVATRSAALASSIYMVCRKMEREEVGFWNDIQTKVKKRVEEKLEQFWDEGIAGGDFFISAIGPGLESYSKYNRVETYDGKVISTIELLQYIRAVSTDYLVHHLLRNASTEAIDKEAQFYLTYRWTFLDNKVEYDDARKIASAEGIDLEKLAKGNGFVKKTTKYIRVHGPQKRSDLKPAKSMNMVDAMHLACKYWEKNRKGDLNRLLAETGYAHSNAFWQFCQAVAECFDNGNKEKQLLEGLLMGKENYEKAADNIPTQTELWDDEE